MSKGLGLIHIFPLRLCCRCMPAYSTNTLDTTIVMTSTR